MSSIKTLNVVSQVVNSMSYLSLSFRHDLSPHTTEHQICTSCYMAFLWLGVQIYGGPVVTCTCKIVTRERDVERFDSIYP